MYMSRCHAFYPLLVRSDLAGADAATLTDHLADCEACREAAALLRAPAVDTGADEEDGLTLAPGTRVDNLRIDAAIGRGGSSIVYRARHVTTGQTVAVKVMHRRILGAHDAVERFVRDARLGARLRSEHVCRVLTFGQLPTGEPFTVMEHLEGEDLQTRLERGGPIAGASVIEHALQVCTGLIEAHGRGIVHRDLKPANLFCTARPDGSPLVKILDFGIAKPPPEMTPAGLTATGVRLGSLPYMSPEQLRSSRSVDARTDVWSLGATLYHLVSGRLPFSTEGSPVELALRIWTEPPAPLVEAPAGLAQVITTCLARAPDARYQDVVELARALASIADDAIGRAQVERIERIARTLAGDGT